MPMAFPSPSLRASASPPASGFVTCQREGVVFFVTIDNPTVEALGVDVRRGLLAVIEAAKADDAVAVVLTLGAGRNLIAGTDIREFGQEDPLFWRRSPLLAELVDRRADFANLNHTD